MDWPIAERQRSQSVPFQQPGAAGPGNNPKQETASAQRETFMTPAKIEYEIGSTIYGQPLRLVRSKSSSGQMEWILARDQADQRDDNAVIAGLTRDHILKMAEAVKANAPY